MMKFTFLLLTLLFFDSVFLFVVFFYCIVFVLICMVNSYSGFYCGVSFGGDMLSLSLSILTFWLTILVYSTKGVMSSAGQWFSILINLLVVLLFLCFISMNMMFFFVCFEFVLIPILGIIFIWGYQPERMRAGIYMFFYTVGGSLPLMVGFMHVSTLYHSLDYLLVEGQVSVVCVVLLSIAFMVSMPVYLLHSWLPSAHVEAPVGGSMILAGIMLKLGGYGLVRVNGWIEAYLVVVSGYFVMLSLWGGIIICVMSLFQSDLSVIIAYSSVVHMGIVIFGLYSLSILGFKGAIYMMVSHGLASSGMFYFSGALYDVYRTRMVLLSKGVLVVNSIMGLWWFFLVFFNSGLPPSLNFISELIVFMSLFGWCYNIWVLVFGFLLFSSVYSVYIFSYLFHGVSWLIYPTKGPVMLMYTVFFYHVFPLLGVIGFYVF